MRQPFKSIHSYKVKPIRVGNRELIDRLARRCVRAGGSGYDSEASGGVDSDVQRSIICQRHL